MEGSRSFCGATGYCYTYITIIEPRGALIFKFVEELLLVIYPNVKFKLQMNLFNFLQLAHVELINDFESLEWRIEVFFLELDYCHHQG